jgi:long-subunit acyl-CoA synthetase (AMP-forming)
MMRKHQGFMSWLISCPSSAETLKRAFMYFPDRKCLGEREKKTFKGQEIVGNYKWKSFAEIWESLKFTACGLTYLNNQVSKKRGFVGICSINRTDWFVADWACVYNGMVSVPLARTRFLVDDLSGGIATINNAECFAIVCSSEVIEKIIEASCETPSLQYIIQMEPLNQKFSSKVQKFISQSKVKIMSLSDLQGIGKKYIHDIIEIKPNDLRTIVYTRY